MWIFDFITNSPFFSHTRSPFLLFKALILKWKSSRKHSSFWGCVVFELWNDSRYTLSRSSSSTANIKLQKLNRTTLKNCMYTNTFVHSPPLCHGKPNKSYYSFSFSHQYLQSSSRSHNREAIRKGQVQKSVQTFATIFPHRRLSI